MKSKKVPDDIRSKTIKEAQREIKDIILLLESEQTSLENSIDQYNRMMQLNCHIQEQFKKKIKETKISKIYKPEKSLLKDKK